MDSTVKWDLRFLELAKLISSWSKDPSTKTGAAIIAPNRDIISVGYNGFPRSMPDNPELYNDRSEKYSRIVHCEMNALMTAAKSVQGCTLYTYPFLSCDRCMVHMVQAGITRFVAPTPSADALSRWDEQLSRTKQYAKECGCTIVEYELDEGRHSCRGQCCATPCDKIAGK